MNDYDREKVFSQIMPRNYGRFDLVEALEAEGFFKAPASTKYHGNYEGGGVFSIIPLRLPRRLSS